MRGRKPGTPKTGGRRKGSKNTKTRILEEKAKDGILPLDYALEVMRCPKNSTNLRLDAAKLAAPYLHARRAPEEGKGKTMAPMIYIHPDLEGPSEENAASRRKAEE